jgi:hypothetical protein
MIPSLEWEVSLMIEQIIYQEQAKVSMGTKICFSAKKDKEKHQ